MDFIFEFVVCYKQYDRLDKIWKQGMSLIYCTI